MNQNRVAALGFAVLTALMGVLLVGQWLVAAQTTVLYDGAQGGLPNTQNLVYETLSGNFPAASKATQTEMMGYTLLNTMAEIVDYAGYGADPNEVMVMPILSRTTGFTLTFGAQISAEMHVSPNRAGFSVFALSSDNQGIELGFWDDRIWAQEGNGANLFTQAEGVDFDTTAAFVTYSLHIQNETYRLLADGSEILTGSVRSYTAWEPPLPILPDPYEVPNAIFLGDNTTSASAAVRLAYVGVMTPTVSMPPVEMDEFLYLPFVTR